MIKKIEKLNYSIVSQLMNYDGKIIGVEVLIDDKIIYVPTFPSAPIWDRYPLKWIDSYEGISYLETKDLLEDIYKKSNKSIPCLPVIKVIEDNLIIGNRESVINVVLKKNLSWRVIEFNEKSLRLTNVARI